MMIFNCFPMNKFENCFNNCVGSKFPNWIILSCFVEWNLRPNSPTQLRCDVPRSALQAFLCRDARLHKLWRRQQIQIGLSRAIQQGRRRGGSRGTNYEGVGTRILFEGHYLRNIIYGTLFDGHYLRDIVSLTYI